MELDKKKLRNIYQQFKQAGCFLDWEEWQGKVIIAYLELIKVAKQKSLITYGELGLGILRISNLEDLPGFLRSAQSLEELRISGRTQITHPSSNQAPF